MASLLHAKAKSNKLSRSREASHCIQNPTQYTSKPANYPNFFNLPKLYNLTQY